MTRADKLRLYIFNILDELLKSKEYKINTNFLDKDIENYSLDKLPVSPVVSIWIDDSGVYRDVYNFRSRKVYGADVIDNLSNIGFFEEFERKIYKNNKNKILPEIEGIESIECLNCGALSRAGTQTAEFAIQIQINYEE